MDDIWTKILSFVSVGNLKFIYATSKTFRDKLIKYLGRANYDNVPCEKIIEEMGSLVKYVKFSPDVETRILDIWACGNGDTQFIEYFLCGECTPRKIKSNQKYITSVFQYIPAFILKQVTQKKMFPLENWNIFDDYDEPSLYVDYVLPFGRECFIEWLRRINYTEIAEFLGKDTYTYNEIANFVSQHRWGIYFMEEHICNLKFESHNKDLYMVAIEQDSKSLKYIVNQTKEMCVRAIKLNPHAIKWVRDQSEELCFLAIDCGIKEGIYPSRFFDFINDRKIINKKLKILKTTHKKLMNNIQ